MKLLECRTADMPFAGAVQHRFDGQRTPCGVPYQKGDLIYDDDEMHSVWTGLCPTCYPRAYPD